MFTTAEEFQAFLPPVAAALSKLPDGPVREQFLAEMKAQLPTLMPLYERALEKMRAAPDDEARREILTAFAEELKRYCDAGRAGT